MRNIASIIAPAALAAGLVGCAVTAADGRRLALGSDEFRAYAEEVFREQNRVATDLAFALEDADAGGAVPAALAGAEDALLEACARLNELATLRRDGENVGARRGARNARSVPGCEAATRAAQGALDDAK
jgi:hypothetical protein